MKLFAVLLGGRADGCNTELHDVVFVVGENLEATYPQLAKKWFGSLKRLHVDSHIELKYVDGHEVILSHDKPEKGAEKLFFANFGGYKENYFGEVHQVNFYVAKGKPEVLQRAKLELGLDLIEPHCDDNLVIDDVLEIANVDALYVHLIPTSKTTELAIKSKYIRLDNQLKVCI